MDWLKKLKETYTMGEVVETPPNLLQSEVAVKVITEDQAEEKLQGKVEPVSGQAWLTPTGELRVKGCTPDLAGEIIRLTGDNLSLQKELLLKHCESYGKHHFRMLQELWEERAAIMEYNGGLSREEAELEAAQILHLVAFLDELRNEGTNHGTQSSNPQADYG